MGDFDSKSYMYTPSCRYQSRYWILLYYYDFPVEELKQTLVVRQGLQKIGIYETVSKSSPLTVVFLQFDKQKQYMYKKNKTNSGDGVLVGPREFKYPVAPTVVLTNGFEKFQIQLNKIREECSPERNSFIPVFADKNGNLKVMEKDVFLEASNYDVNIFNNMTLNELNEFLFSLNQITNNTLEQTFTVFSLLLRALEGSSSNNINRDKIFYFIMKFKTKINIIDQIKNNVLEQFDSNESRLLKSRDSRKQNRRALEDQEKIVKDDDSFKVKELDQPALVSNFSLSNEAYEVIQDQILKDDFKNINYEDIYKIEFERFKTFLNDIIKKNSIDVSNTENKIIRFFAIEFSLKKSFKTNDKPKWFSEIYSFLPTFLQEKYKRNVKK